MSQSMTALNELGRSASNNGNEDHDDAEAVTSVRDVVDNYEGSSRSR